MNSLSTLTTASSSFKDAHNRTVILRGTNLSGSSKLPYGRASHESYHFYEDGESGDLTYIGRPFLLWDGDLDLDNREDEIIKTHTWYTSNWEDSADCHLARLKGWGFNLLRYVVTWEALEHDGPGKYDYEFIEFTIAILRKCKHYGFRVYIDPHQDVWSRFSGGSGAPYWTLTACGLNPRNFTQTGTAILHHEYTPPSTTTSSDPAQMPSMLWSTGYNRLAAQTLFTLFFGGRTYAPKCIIDGLNIQDYLQSHFIEAFGLLADKIREADDQALSSSSSSSNERLLDECIIGWDSMNEPFPGFCAMEKLDWNTTTAHGAALKKGPQPNVMQNLCLGMGIKQSDIEDWDFGSFGPTKLGEIEIDPRGAKMWITSEEAGEDENGYSARWGWQRETSSWPLGTCIWALHGVWSFSDGTPRILNPTYFASPSSSSSSSTSPFLTHFWLPHFKNYASRIRSASSHPSSILFIQPPVFEPPPRIPESILKGRACLSTHYYDGLTLVTRHWGWYNADALGVIRGKYRWTWQAVKIGSKAIRASFQDQLGILKSDARLISSASEEEEDYSSTLSYPTMIGEIGTPMDMDRKRSYGLPYADPGDGDRYKGDYSEQTKALDASLNALDGDNALNASIWCYAPGNGHRWGDGWNMEDLSLWSRDDVGVEGGKEMEGEGEETEVNEVKDAEVKDMDIGSRANLLNNVERQKSLPPLPPITPTASTTIDDDATSDRDEETGRMMYPKGGKFLHVDIGAAFAVTNTTTTTTTNSSTAASPLSTPGTRTPSPSPVNAAPNPPNPFATTTSLPFVRSPDSPVGKDHLEFKMRPPSPPPPLPSLPLSIALSRSLPPTPHRSFGSRSSSPPLMMERGGRRTPSPDVLLEQLTRRINSTATYLTFLTSGARALKAFCRPYPMASFGKPVNIAFNVDTGEFKMGVLLPVVSHTETMDMGENNSNPPTEIFVPLVHYASKRVLKTITTTTMEQQRRRKVKDRSSTMDTTTSLRNRHSSHSPYLQSSPLNPRTRMMTMDYDEDDTVPPTPQSMTMHPSPVSLSPSAAASASSMTLANMLANNKPGAAYPHQHQHQHQHQQDPDSVPISTLTSIEDDLDMDLEVQVSHGKAVLEGQVLKWYYDLPTKKNDDGSGSGDPESVLYEIYVKKGTGKGVVDDDGGDEADEGEQWSCPRMCWEALDRCRKGLVGC